MISFLVSRRKLKVIFGRYDLIDHMKTKVIYYTNSISKNKLIKFIDCLQKRQQVKVLKLFQLISDYGLVSVLPHLKKLKGTPLWEIRILGRDNIRIFYLVPYKDSVLLLHGFVKKTQKTPVKEINKALKRYYEWLDK